MTAKRSTYDVEEWSKRLLVALDDMTKNEKPGAVKRGGKRDVLSAMREKIREVMNAGYSATQVAGVLRSNGMPVLPKTITETVHEAKPASRKTRRRSKQEAPQMNETTHALDNAATDAQQNAAHNVTANTQPNAPRSGSFEIEPDTPDV